VRCGTQWTAAPLFGEYSPVEGMTFERYEGVSPAVEQSQSGRLYPSEDIAFHSECLMVKASGPKTKTKPTKQS
jgi:hypothetical protein